MRIQNTIIALVGVVLMCSCAQSDNSADKAGFNIPTSSIANAEVAEQNEAEPTPATPTIRLKNAENVDGINYSIQLLTALEFIERRGEKPAEADIAQLEKEGVLLLEFEETDSYKSIFESSKIQMEQNDAVQYLSSRVVGNVQLEQNGEQLAINGAIYERDFGSSNKIRVVFFVQGANTDGPVEFQYYDQLFGAGLIKLVSEF